MICYMQDQWGGHKALPTDYQKDVSKILCKLHIGWRTEQN